MRRRRPLGPGVLALGLALLAGCAQTAPQAGGGLRLAFEDRPAPGAFSFEGTAVPGRRDGAAGLWATVPGLKRPERAEVENLANGRSVVVALFSGGRTGTVGLSWQAADSLGIGDRQVRVRVTALRQAPRLDTTTGGF